VAALVGHRFLITADGYASVEPAKGATVHGVLWRITPRDRVSLDAWENVQAGLYRAAMLSVRTDAGLVLALIYFARRSGEGRPKPGYIELIVAAAREWRLPEDYVGSLQSWAGRPLGSGTRKIGAFL
jgi:hypothetical protein